ncbi:unnamed protein product [Bemisia tabaci]|uniref:DH domain-containing protein n=1 Tax=Bemisia tabaci TaxID=7038 RepID=A0A9P0C5Q4_BEMTA|nr:unnamed protein product [Bemisia tabaci]
MAAAGGTQPRPAAAAFAAPAASPPPPPPHHYHRHNHPQNHHQHHQHNHHHQNRNQRRSTTLSRVPNSKKFGKESHVKEELEDRMAPTIMQSDNYLSAMPPLSALSPLSGADYCGGGGVGGGSALFKSMKYAETWLNLTVAERGTPGHRPRPKLLINDRPPPPFFLPANLCTCPDSGRNTRSKKATCSKCKGQRIKFQPEPAKKTRSADQFYSVRIPKQAPSRNPIFRYDVDFFEDPYSVMRRCRLQSPPNEKPLEKSKKSRAKSSSPPSRRKRKEEETLIKGNRCPSPDEISNRFEDYVKQKEKENQILNGGGRRSILDCSVNAYELIRLKNDKGNDSSRNRPASKFNTLTSTLNKNKLINSILNRKPSSDEAKKSSPLGVKIAGQRINVFDESKPRIDPVHDRIDEFVYESDHTTDSYETVCFNGYQDPVKNGYHSSQERLSPVRNGYSTNQETPVKNGYSSSQEAISSSRNGYHDQGLESFGHRNSRKVSPVRGRHRDSQDAASSVKSEYQNSHEVERDRYPSKDRLSPVRPPRRTKGQGDENESPTTETAPPPPPALPEVQQETLIVPKNRVNFDLKHDSFSNKNNTLTSSTSLEIKSILKKPPNFNNLFNFNSILAEDSTHSHEREQEQERHENPPPSAYQSTVIVLDGSAAQADAKSTNLNKKKKQVQFRENKVEVIPRSPEKPDEKTKFNAAIEQPTSSRPEESVTRQRTESDRTPDDDLKGHFSAPAARSAIEVDSTTRSTDGINISPTDVPVPCGSETTFWTTPGLKRLQRSLSERIATASTSSADNGNAFNDTMRLNLRMGRRGDSRVMFAIDENGVTQGSARVISPSRCRPKEPPPPPPPPAQRALSPPKPPPRLIFPFAKRPEPQPEPEPDYNSQMIYIENNYIDFVCGQPPDSQSIKLEIKCNEKDKVGQESEEEVEDEKECSTVSIVPIEVSPRRVSTVMIGGDSHPPPESPSVTVIGPADKADEVNKVTISVGQFKGTDSFYQSSIPINCADRVAAPPDDCDTKTTAKTEPESPTPTPSTPQAGTSSRLEGIAEEPPDAEKDSSEAENLMSCLIRRNYDPVLALRQNLIPHICGKPSEPAPSLDKYPEESSWESSANSVSSGKGSSAPPTPTPSTVSLCSDRPEIFYSSKNIISDSNHYESVSDPIYEEISDIPPPLPLSPPPPLTTLEAIIDDTIPTRSIFEGASKYDILSYLVDAKQRCIATAEEPEYVIEESIMNQTIMEEENETATPAHSRINSLDLSCSRHSQASCSDSSEDSGNHVCSSNNSSIRHTDKVRKSCAEIERNDSGVGSETSQCSRSKWQHLSPDTFREDQQHICEDCDQPVETQVSDSGLMFAPLVCRKCSKRRTERREIIAEIVETEEKYGRDLHIILEEFYRPMLVAGLLTPEQLTFIFLNVEELLENNVILAEKLRDALEIAVEQGDEDLLTVNIGRIFLETTSMLHAFESYCTKQGAAAMMLANLEKEKELLRIFLRVSQMENSVLRRMNLNSFLMVPVQRVTKYPLLLARLYKVTPPHHSGRELLKEAQHKIELHLEHMNSLAKDIGSTKLWRRISIINGRRSNSETDMITIKLRKIAVDVLDWAHEDVRFAIEGRLLFTQPTDHNWRKGRTIKLTPINAMVVTLGKPTENYHPESEEILTFPRNHGMKEATLLLLKEKSGRFALLREPLFLDRCIVCTDSEWEEYFEVQELVTKDTYIFKAEDSEKTKLWYRQVQYHAQGLGQWRKRRNALANIMINGMQLRS